MAYFQIRPHLRRGMAREARRRKVLPSVTRRRVTCPVIQQRLYKMIRRERQALRTRQAFAGPPWRFWGRTDGSRPYKAAEASGNNIHWATETPPSTGVIPYFINRLYGSYFTNHTIEWFQSIDAQLARVFLLTNVCYFCPHDNVHGGTEPEIMPERPKRARGATLRPFPEPLRGMRAGRLDAYKTDVVSGKQGAGRTHLGIIVDNACLCDTVALACWRR